MRQPDPEPDRVLLERIRGGDSHAFETLMRRHEPAMLARCTRLVGRGLRGRVSVSDVLQEARMAAFTDLPSLATAGDASIRRWLLRIVKHKAIDAVRAQQSLKRDLRREDANHSSPGSSLPSLLPSPSQLAIAGEAGEASRKSMAALPEDYREVLRLTRVMGMSLREAADCMGRSREAVKKLYGRALARFGELFERNQGGRRVR